MKIVVQRVKMASVSVDGKEVGRIDKGLLLFVGFTENDDVDKINYMVNKVINLTSNKEKGMGGIDTKGVARKIY